MKLQYYVLHIDTNSHNWPTNGFKNLLDDFFDTILAVQRGGQCFALCEDSCDLKLYREYERNYNFYYIIAYIEQISDREHVDDLYHALKFRGEVIVDNSEKWEKIKNESD